MDPKPKILDFLSPHTLEQMYEGHEEGILLILGKKTITNNLIRLKARDAKYEDNCICDSQEKLGEVRVGDLRWFMKSTCLNMPQWRRSLVPGRGLLVGRVEELDTEGLIESQMLPDHTTHPVIQQN